MYRRTTLLLTWFLSGPFVGAQGTPAKLPSSPGGAEAFCSRVGEVRGRDVLAQTFLLRQDDGQMETVPFSRWTEFFKISLDSRRGSPREIEPTDIRLGDRLCVLLDPNEATANVILVLERARAVTKIAAGPGQASRYSVAGIVDWHRDYSAREGGLVSVQSLLNASLNSRSRRGHEEMHV
jgi:hypothetical protein